MFLKHFPFYEKCSDIGIANCFVRGSKILFRFLHISFCNFYL